MQENQVLKECDIALRYGGWIKCSLALDFEAF
jgi:hypothetical protein